MNKILSFYGVQCKDMNNSVLSTVLFYIHICILFMKMIYETRNILAHAKEHVYIYI